MALYQPSFCIPRNEAIDATNQDDMTFSFKLNGNNPLVAYNIQIFDNDTNELVYELVSTENERAIEKNINEIRSWLSVQEKKQEKVTQSEEEYKASTIRTAFRDSLRKFVSQNSSKLLDMTNTLEKKKKGESLGQTEIVEYFQYWGDFILGLETYIGDEKSTSTTTGEGMLKTIEGWLNIDPYRKDGIEYKEKNEHLVDRGDFNEVKDLYLDFKNYYNGVGEAREAAGASDTTYINDTTLTKARQALYLIYSEFSNEAYFGKDLYTAINNVWIRVNFNRLEEEINNVYSNWVNQINQQEYALAHLTGGYAKQDINVYKSATASSSNIKYILKKGTELTIITDTPTVPSGWYCISINGQKGYVQSQYVTLYPNTNGKYWLKNPIYPTNYEGEQNTVYHQIPLKVTNDAGKIVDTLQNGKGYKWSVTLYWNTSGKYEEDDAIYGSLVSVENYFDTRNRPIIGIENAKQVFSIPNNYVTVKNSFVVDGEDNKKITVKAGTTVRLISLTESDENFANIEFTQEGTNERIFGTTHIDNLNGLGLYDDDTITVLPVVLSKKATFVGHYEQAQHVSIAYFRWVLYKLQYDTEEIVETVKDTGMVPSADFRFVYEGFLDDEKYAIQTFVQTLDNVEVQTGLIKFKSSYITYPIENMVNAENSPIEHGIIVEWSNLRLIQGEVDGEYHYEKDLPVQGKTSLTLDKGSVLTFDKDKGKPLAVDFDTNQILCTKFDEDRPTEVQRYYTASGLDDNGEVISKTLELIPDENTQTTGKAILRYTVKTARENNIYEQEIIASPLYWYVIIMTSTGFTIYTKYAKGLFPAIDQYPHLNKFTKTHGLYPDALTYLEEPSDRVEYNYQTIVDRDGNEI